MTETELNERIAEITEKTRKIRKELKMCTEIEERSKTMEEKLRRLDGERIGTEERGENGDEHVFERSGGTGRPHDAGRN